ncbi:MAG TPA: glycosyltransferase family 2 protein [Polyangiales bacterium]
MGPVRISIVTPSFNQAQYLERTLESVLNQRGDFSLEYRVVDGGSSDGSVDILRRYGERLSWTSERDRGQVDAINKGLCAISGDIVGWVNSDDVLLPGALDAVARAFREHPEAEWLHGDCEIIDPDDRPVRKWVSLYKRLRAQRHSFANLLTENYVSQMTVFWRRSVHDQIGYLDPALHFAFDYDLWLRLARRGDPLYLPRKLACFRWYPASKSGSQFDRQFQEDFEVAAKYAKPSEAWAMRRKQLKTWAIVNVYRALALGRLGSSGGPTR